VRQLRELEDDLQSLRVQVLYEQAPLIAAAERLAEGKGDGFFQLICENQGLGGWEDYGQLWEDACRKWFAVSYMRSEEREAWIRLGRLLGRGGLKQQEQVLDRCGCELKRLEEEAREELKRRGRMYVTMGICCGVFLTVLLL